MSVIQIIQQLLEIEKKKRAFVPENGEKIHGNIQSFYGTRPKFSLDPSFLRTPDIGD